MTKPVIDRFINRLKTLEFFPVTTPESVDILMELILEFVSTDEQLDWLGKRVIELYREWPSVRELRAVFCSHFKPADGIDVESEKFPEGVPSKDPQIPAQRFFSPLSPGHMVTADEEFEKTLRTLSAMSIIQRGRRKPREDPPTVQEGAPTEKCRKCGGPGVLESGAFCDCPMGRDLTGIARRRPSSSGA